jgi:arylsulfatase A-like enzyme
MVGKWHMGRDRGATVSVDGNANGVFTEYDYDYGLAEPGTMVYHPMRRGFDACYGFINLGGQSYWQYEHGFFENLWRFELNTPIDGVEDDDGLATYLTTRLTEEACSFIETQAAAATPFFLHLAYNAVHTPMEAPSSPPGLGEGDPGWYPDADWYNAKYPNMWQTPDYSASNGQAEDQAVRAVLMAMLYHMDQGIGQVVDALKTNGVWENTIVVFWSDNGGASASRASNAPLRERKHFNYEGGVRVPMAICWPAGLGAYSNTSVSAPVMSIDILPTVLAAAEIEPLNGFDGFDGKNLLPLIRGQVEGVHDALYWSEGGEAGEYAVRQGDWKLYIDEDVYELYNLRDDIGETNDLAALYPEKVRSMRQAFFAWLTEMVHASGDRLDERLWSTTTPPDAGKAAIEIQGAQAQDGQVELEYDEKVGWLTGGPVFEATDALVDGWAPVDPGSLEQIDRFLDTATYRARFDAATPVGFLRVLEE